MEGNEGKGREVSWERRLGGRGVKIRVWVRVVAARSMHACIKFLTKRGGKD